jgi:hypothetical protein
MRHTHITKILIFVSVMLVFLHIQSKHGPFYRSEGKPLLYRTDDKSPEAMAAFRDKELNHGTIYQLSLSDS